jgi:hypothetical protein
LIQRRPAELVGRAAEVLAQRRHRTSTSTRRARFLVMSNGTPPIPDWLQADMAALVAAEDQIQTAAAAQQTAQTDADAATAALDAANQALDQAQQAGDAALNQLLNDWHSHMGTPPPPPPPPPPPSPAAPASSPAPGQLPGPAAQQQQHPAPAPTRPAPRKPGMRPGSR